MSKKSILKRLVMWVAFVISPYGATLPRDGNERGMPLGIAIAALMFFVVLAGLLMLGLYAWLDEAIR
jgi:uncharacterized membrane-anchored protein